MVRWHHNEWSPDSCECYIQFVFDDDLPQDQRVHLFFAKLKNCSKHPNLTGTTLFETAVGESSRVQKLIGQIKSTISGASTLDEAGSLIKSIRNWTGTDSSRVLNFSVSGTTLTSNQKTTIQNWCDSNLGTGKVVIS